MGITNNIGADTNKQVLAFLHENGFSTAKRRNNRILLEDRGVLIEVTAVTVADGQVKVDGFEVDRRPWLHVGRPRN